MLSNSDPWADPDFVLDEREAEGLRPPARPHPGDPIVLYGQRRTVLSLTDRGSGPLVVADDEAGLRIERYVDRLVWDVELGAWR